MKQLIWLVVLCLPLLLQAQNDTSSKGIKWAENLSWEQIKTKAKTENKYIFVDCYATWCEPCKYMDKVVYSDKIVGDYANDKFIAVQVQMDTSKHDNFNIQKWYSTAYAIQKEYKILAFPTYLFFSPDGKIVHKAVGAKGVDEFLPIFESALNPAKQYYTLLEYYRNGKRDYNKMPFLAISAKGLKDNMGDTIAWDYLNNYLYKNKTDSQFTKSDFEFIRRFTKSSNSKGFKLYYSYQERIDSIVGEKGYAKSFIDYIISVEEIDSRLWKNNNVLSPIAEKPNWKNIEAIISKKYNVDYAKRNVLNAKLRWYQYKKEWSAYCATVIYKVEKYGPFGIFSDLGSRLNANAWDLFQHSTNESQLLKALSWSDSSIKISLNPNQHYFDTYANLLYKLGRHQEAIDWEERAVKLEEEIARKQKRIPYKGFRETLEKMKSGQPTWDMK